MSFTQQQLLIPTKHADEIALLTEIVRLIADGNGVAAQALCMKRLSVLEAVAEPRLVKYDPVLENAA